MFEIKINDELIKNITLHLIFRKEYSQIQAQETSKYR